MPQDEGLTPAPPVEKDIDLIVKPPGRVGLLQRSHETGRGDLLKNLLTPLTTVDQTTKSDIWDRVFGAKDFSDDDLQQYLTPLPIDQTVKADIWDIRQRFTGHLPAAAIPKAAPPKGIPTELPAPPARGAIGMGLGGRAPTSWPPPGRVPYDVQKSRAEKLRADLGKPKTPPGFTGPLPAPMELITPLLPEGRSKEMTVSGITGSFNFELEPRTGGTPGTRYAFETPFDPETGQGLRYYFQLEKEYQGSRWEDAWHAYDDFERYKGMEARERKKQLDRVWAGDPDIGQAIDRAAAGFKTFDQLKEDLAPFNTHRQISVPRPEPRQPAYPNAPGMAAMLAGMAPPTPGLEGAVRAEPRISQTARELIQLRQFGEPGKRWEENVKAAENYQTLVDQPDKTRRELLKTRFASQPEVFEAIDFHAHHKLPFDLLKEDLANLDTVPPADLALPRDPRDDLPGRPQAEPHPDVAVARYLYDRAYPERELTPEEEGIELQAKIKQQLAPMGFGEWASHALYGPGVIDRMPFSPTDLFKMTTLVIAAQRFNAGVAEDWEIALLADWDRQETDLRDRGGQTLTTEVAEVVSWIPGFGVEMALTGGIYRASKKVAMESIRRFALAELPKIARRATRIKGSRFASAAYGSAVRAAVLTPTKGMPRVMEEIIAREDDDFLWAVFKRIPAAYADTFIETFSEISGRAIGKGLGSVFGRIPGAAKVRALKTATMMNWLNSNPGKTTADFANVLRKAGWNGVFLEFMEERVAEPPRWILGLEEMPEGGYFSEERLHQFLVEGLAFSIPGMGHTAIRVFEQGTRGEQQKLYDDIREFSELTRKGLTAEEIWQQSPTMIKDAITKAVDAGEKVEDIIDVQTSVLAPVMMRKEPGAIRPDRSGARPIGADVELRGEVPEPLFMTYPRDYKTQREQMIMASMDIEAGEALEAEDTQRLIDAAAKYEQESRDRTEKFTEKWGALPDGVGWGISQDFPLNPKVEELVYAINSTGAETRMSGDLYSDRAVYVDISREDVGEVDQDALPEGWAIVTAQASAVDEFLGDELTQDELESLEATRSVDVDHRLVRAGADPVSPEDIDAIVKAMPTPAIEPEVLPPDAAGRPEVITPEKAAEDVRRGVEAKKKTQFNTTVMEVNGQFQSQLTDGMGDERFTSPIVATEAEARQLAQDWMKAEAERIIAAKEAAPAEVAPAEAAPAEAEVSPEEAVRLRAMDEANAVLADMEVEDEIQYGMNYRDFLFGEGEDPGTDLPLDVSGPIRMQMEEIATRLGIARPGVPTELPPTPDAAAEAAEPWTEADVDKAVWFGNLEGVLYALEDGGENAVVTFDDAGEITQLTLSTSELSRTAPTPAPGPEIAAAEEILDEAGEAQDRAQDLKDLVEGLSPEEAKAAIDAELERRLKEEPKAKRRKVMGEALDKLPVGTTFEITEEDVKGLSLSPGHTFIGQWEKEELETDEYGRQVFWRETTRNLQHKKSSDFWELGLGTVEKAIAREPGLPDLQVGDTGTWKGHRVKIRKLSPKGDRAFLDDVITGKSIRNGVNLQELRQETADAASLRADIEAGADMLREVPDVPGTEIWRSKVPMTGDPVYDPEQGFGKILDEHYGEGGSLAGPPTHVTARMDSGKVIEIPWDKIELFRRAAEKAGRPTPGIPDLARREAEARMRELDAYPVGTNFELELEDIPPGIENKDDWTGSWTKMRDLGDDHLWVNSEAPPGKQTLTSEEIAKAEHASGGVFSLRPERPSPNVVDPPATAPPGKKLSIFAEDERETNPGFLDPVETGQPFAARMMQGRGASLVTIYGANAVQAGVASPVAGAAQYYSFTDHHAKRYGDEVTEHDVKLNNPMVIDNDRQWKDLLEKADAWALYSADTHLDAPEDRPEAARRFQNYLRELGHDGIIVKVPDIRDLGPYGEGAKRLRETWGETQAVVFYADKPMTVSELKDAVMARTDIPEEQVDAWIALLKSHAEGMGMTLQSWVDRTITKVDGKPTIRGKDGKLPPGATDILYQRRSPLTEAQFMKIWEEMAPALREEKLKTVGEDVVEDAMNDVFAKGWSLRSSFNTAKQVREFFRAENRAAQRTYGDKAARFLAPDIEAIGASLLVRAQKGPRAFPGWKTLLIEELGPGVDLTGVDLKELYRRSKVVFERTVRATVSGKLPSGETLGKLYDKGEASKHWYDKFWTEIQVVFGEDAELFANLVAAHSQMTDTTRNAQRGLQAYIELKTGVPFTAVGPARNVILANLNRAARGEAIQGIKVTNFLKNLMGDLSAVTLDRHMMGIFFGDKNKAPTERQHQIVATTVTSKARKVGVEPAQYQAALWAAVRNASEERAAPLEQIIFRLLNTDPRFAGLKADLIKNAEDPEAVKKLLDAASAENQSKRIPEAEEVLPFASADSEVRSVAARMETPPSEDALRRALDRSSTFLDEQHMEDWFEAQVITGPGRIKGQAAAKAKAIERHKPAEQREDRFVSLSLRARETKAVTVGGRSLGRDATLASPLTGEERLLEAIRGPLPAAEPLSTDPELKTRRQAQEQSQDEQPMLPLALDMEDEYRTAQASDMFFMDVAPVAREIVGKSNLSGIKLPEAIRRVLQAADEPLGIDEILKELRARGFKFKNVARARAHLQPTLLRMKDLKSESRRDPQTGRIDRMVYFPLPKADDILFQRPGPLTQAEFMTVWEENAQYLRVEAWRIVKSRSTSARAWETADELSRDTFTKAWAKIDRFVDKLHLKNSLNMINRRMALDWLKHSKAQVSPRAIREGLVSAAPGAEMDLPKTEKQIFFEEIREIIKPVIEKMPQMNREALLSMFDEVTARQTAREMGIPVPTLMSRRKIAFDKIREHLARYDLDRDDFFQKGKGAIEFLREGRAILHLMEAADISTLIHESAHLFRRDLNAADSGILEDWLKIKDGNWLEKHEETLARALERYLHEGITPEGEPKLTRLFEKFKTWLRGIYETITGSPIDIQIPESVRPVLARMVGVTEAAQAVPAEEGAIPPTPAEAEAKVDPYEFVAREFKGRSVPVAKPGFNPATQHRKILATFPANETLRVRDGLAYSTNGTISLITRTDLVDGRYSPYVKGQPKAFKKVRADKKAYFPDVGATRADGHFHFRAMEDLRRAMSVLRTAAPARMPLFALQLEIKGNTAILRATDGHRATLNTVPFSWEEDTAKEGTYLIPRAAIELVLKDKKNPTVEVFIGNGAVTMLTDHLAVSALQIQGEFPKFEQLMPDPARELHVDRDGLLRSIKKLKENMDPTEPGVYFWMHDEGTLEMGVLGKEIKKGKNKGKSETFTTEITFKETTPTATASPTNVTILMPRSKAGKENSDFSLDIYHLTDIVEGVSGVDVLIGVPKDRELIFGFAGSSAIQAEVVQGIPAPPGKRERFPSPEPGRPSMAQTYINTLANPDEKAYATQYLDWSLKGVGPAPPMPDAVAIKKINAIHKLITDLLEDAAITPKIPLTPDEVKDVDVDLRTPAQAAGIEQEMQLEIDQYGKGTGQRDYAILYRDWRLGGDIPFPTEETVPMVDASQAEWIRWRFDALAEAANVPAREKPEGVPETPTDLVDMDEEEEETSLHMQLAYALLGDLREGIKINNPALTKRANEIFGGTRGEGAYNPRDSYDAMEVALNLYIEDEGLIQFDDPEGTVKRLAALHALMPVQADRTEEQEELQQFSSPPDLAFAAVYASGLERSRVPRTQLVALEPSAGTGMIAVMLDQTGRAEVFVNEKAPRRVRLLEEQEFETSQIDAEFLHTDLPEEIQPDVIVMNPPFSATGGRTKVHATKFGAKHITEALARLNPGGRLVAIVGQGMAMDKKAFRKWWKQIMMKHTVRANVGIAGKHYKKWGTTFGQQIIVIDKIGPHDPVTVPFAQQVKKVIMGKDLSPLKAIRLLKPLAEEGLSEQVRQRAAETGIPPTPTDVSGRRRGERGPVAPAGEVLPERRPEGGYQPAPGPPGRAGPEELGGLEPGEGPLPEGVQPGGREGPGVGEPGGPVEPGRTPGVGGVPGPGDIRPTEPVTGVEEQFGSSNTVFTKEEADKAREEIRNRLRDLGRELETGLPPELMRAMFKLGGFYFEGGLREGLREFGPWSKKMIEDLGATVQPILQSVFDTVKGFYEAKAQEDAARFTKERRQAVIEEEAPFSPYTVQKHIFAGAQAHPANIVESSFLATVPPPDPPAEGDEGYMKLPEEVITEGRISDLQAEAVQVILQRWASLFPDGKRPGFWLGDGTGLGKGREIGASMWDNWISGRKRAVWFSTNHQLMADAQRDLTDLGAPMPLIQHQDVKTKGTIPDKDGVLFTAYSYGSYHIRSDAPRFNQMIEWMGPDFDGVIAFDESHLLKNAVKSGRGQSLEEGTQRGRMAAMLEEMFPKARFLYVSATGATVPRNMGYMTRLGLWGPGLPFATFPDFLHAMSRGGMGAMEMLSRDMKSIGAFIARSISYEGVDYENVEHSLTPMEVNQYNNIADIWTELLNEFESAIDTANQPPGGGTSVFTAFYNAQQRFFLLLMASLKLPTLFAEVAKDLELGRSIVINLFNTNEDMVTRMVNQARADGIDLADLDFTPRQIIADLISRHFPLYEYIDEYDPVSGENVKVIRIVDGKPVPNKANLEKQQELLDKLSDVSFPDNPLDTIVNHFGHQNVAEISGRHRRFEGTEHVVRKIEGVSPKKIDQAEIARFQDGEVRIAIITGSAATGISLHSDLSKKNKQRRAFYAFQLSWSADTQLQSFGRVHRSSQSEPPIYKLLRTNLSAEERLVNATSRRLASLGALTSGSREALGGNLFTIEDLTDVYGEAAVQVTYADIREGRIEGIEGGTPLLEVMGMADADGNIKQANNADSNVNRFLNRIMALHVDVQNALFKHFYDHYQRIVLRAQQDGTYDMGIQPVRDRNWNKAERLTLKGQKEVVYTHPHSGAETQLIELIAEFPVPRVTFEQSKGIFSRAFTGITGIDAAAMDLPQFEPAAPGVTSNEGWYVNKKSGKIYTAYKTNRKRFVPNMKAKDPKFESEQPLWTLTNPKGLAHDVPEYQLDPRFNFDKIHPAEAERIWNAELELLPTTKSETIDILTGAVMPIYDKVVGLGDDAMTNLRIVRAVLEDGSSYIGMRIGPRDLGPLRERLGIGTPLGEATPKEIYKMVLDTGAIIELDNGWRIRRAKIHGEWRVELDPRGKYNRDELKGYDGVYDERIDFTRRFFIPIDEIEGPKAIEGILNLHKAVKDILAAGREDPDIPGPAVAGMPEPQQGPPRTSAQEPAVLPGELPGTEPTPTGAIPPPPVSDQPGAARTRLWAEGIPENAVTYRPRKPEFMPGMPRGSRRLQKEWVDPVTGVVWPAQSVPWIKVRVGQDGGTWPEQVPVDDPLAEVRPIDPILALDMDFEMVMPLVNMWEGDDPDTVVSAPEIINSMIKIVEAAGKSVPVRTGRIAERRAAGIFKITVEVIRLARALNIPAASHEIAHALEKAIYGWERGGPWIFRTHAQRRDLIKLGQARYGVPGTKGAVKPKHGMMREGWAEFFRVYLTGEEGEAKSRAPHLHKWFMESFMTEHKEVAEAIEETRRLIFKYRLQGSPARALAQMPWKAPHVGLVRRLIQSINYMNWFEALAPFERLDNMAMKIRGPDNPLPLVERSYMVASALRNAGPVTVHGWMLRSMTDIAGNAVGRPLKDTIDLVKSTGIPDAHIKFMLFGYAKRAAERWSRKSERYPEGMNPGISLADAKAIIELYGNETFVEAWDWFQDWHLGGLNYAMQGGLITGRTLRHIMGGSTDYANLTRIFDELGSDFFKNFDRMTRGGSRNPLPYFRGGGERVRNIFTSAIERSVRIVNQTHQRIVIDLMVKMEYAAHGMGRGIEEVPVTKVKHNIKVLQALEALAKEAVSEEQEGLIEELKQGFAEERLTQEPGEQRSMLEQVLNFYVPAYNPKGADPIVPIFDIQAQRMRWYRVDNDMYESLSMMDPYRLEDLAELFFGKPTRVFRATTTALRPTFAWWRNLTKDPQTWAMQTQTNANALKMAKTWFIMMGDIMFRGRKSPWFQQALRLGVEISTPVGQDIRQVERAVKILFHGKVPEVMYSPLDVARDWLSVPEYATRAAEMKLISQEFDVDPEGAPGQGGWYPGIRPLTFEESIRMRLGLKRATVDFSAAGRVGRVLNQGMPFFNPQLQGFRQFLRILAPEERRMIEGELREVHLLTGKPFTKIAKGRVRRSFIWGVSVFVIPTLYFWWRNKDEEWYKAMPWWEKFTYWNIGTATKIWQIPRAHEYGPFFSAMTEAIADAAYREDPEAMKAVMGQIIRVGNPFSFPPPIQFAVEEWRNIDLWTGSPIVPAREQDYPPGMQFGRYTSKLAIMIGEAFPRQFWASPRIIDHAIRSFFGGLGPDVLQVLGLGVGPGIVSRIYHHYAPHDTEQLEPLPVIGYLAFAQRAGGRLGIRDKFVDQFYEEWNRVEQDYRWQRAMQLPFAGSTDTAKRTRGFPPETVQELHYRNLLNDARYAMSLLNRMARDPSLTQEQLDHVKITQRQIAYDVLQRKTEEFSAMEERAIIAGQRDLTLDEQYRLVERLYIESQVIDNDPGSFWPKVRSMGLDPRRVSDMLNSTRLQIALLQISKAMIPASTPIGEREILNINIRIENLERKRAIERYEGTSPGARPRSVLPTGVIPGVLPPTPSGDILNPRAIPGVPGRDPRAP